MSNSTRTSDENFDETWNNIAQELSDIETPDPSEYSEHVQYTSVSPGNPRDWRPPSDEDIDEYLAEHDDTSYRDPNPIHLSPFDTLTIGAWIISILLLLVGAAIAINIIPAPSSLAFVSACAGLTCAVFAVFLSAHSSSDN